MSTLDVRGLVAGYDGSAVVSDVSLALDAGETLAVVGRNGVGKSVLGRAIVGLLPLLGGSILLDGVDITTWPAFRRVRAGIGYVPQVGGLVDQLTVRENLRLGARAARGRSAPVIPAAAVDACAPLLGRRAGALSGGQRRLVALAVALAGCPSVLIADEPSAGLDIVARGALETMLQATATATVLIEQDATLVDRLADRVLVLG